MAEHRGGSGNFAENPEKASEAGKKAVITAAATSLMTGKKRPKPVKRGHNSGGNFANDREKASEAGKRRRKQPRWRPSG